MDDVIHDELYRKTINMIDHSSKPRVLIASPEIACPPKGMDSQYPFLNARADGFSGVVAALINMLVEQGSDVHVAFPDYRPIFNGHLRTPVEESLYSFGRCIPNDRIHLARDKAFFSHGRTYSGDGRDTIKFSLAFQRELINNIVPLVQPDLIHCHDWMTGLIPAMARQSGISCLFTVHDIHTEKTTLAEIEDRGIDAAFFWENLFYDYFPSSYENSRPSTPVDFLSSGVFAAHFVNTVSPSLSMELIGSLHDVVKDKSLQQALSIKKMSGCVTGVSNTPDLSYDHSLHEAFVAAQRYMELYEKILKRPLIYKKACARDEKTRKHTTRTHPVQEHIYPTSNMPFDDLFEHSDKVASCINLS